jgi:NAD(P)-dependent dehydrogenase (short-subunit alcohol dehydrogenase family)
MNYAGKTAVVTGAASGIGRALAVELAGRGARVAISDVNKKGLAETAVFCAQADVHSYEVDVADRGAVLQYAEEVVRDFGDVHLVVNNAGVALAATVDEMSWEDFDWLMGINFGGVVNGTKAFLPHLTASGDGDSASHLVNISSVFGFIGVPTQSAYNAAKFAVRGFTEALRQEMIIERRPVEVHCVHPGGVKTNIARNARVGGAMDTDREKQASDFARIARTSPERAAKIILRGVDRNSARILIGPDAYVFDAIPRVFGARYEGIAARGMRVVGSRFGVDLGR